MSDNRPLRIDQTVWGYRGWYGHHFGFCPSKVAWDRTMKRLLKAETQPKSYPDSAARTTLLVHPKERGCSLVTIGEWMDEEHRDDPKTLINTVAHEAMHVWRNLCEEIGEREPSSEASAYAIGAIAEQLYDAYQRTRGIRCRGRKTMPSATPKKPRRRRKPGAGRRSRTKSSTAQARRRRPLRRQTPQ